MQCSLFLQMSDKEVDAAIQSVHHQVKKFQPGETIVRINDECTRLMIVTSGSVVAEMVHFDGRSIRIEDIHAVSTLAEAFVYGNHNKYPVTVTAITECSVLSIDRDELLKLFGTNEKILRNYLNAISNRTQMLTEKIMFLSFKTIKGNIASYLLKLDESGRGDVSLPMTQENMAGYFGVARPSLARAMSELQDEGAIIVNRREVKITDRSILLAYIDD